MRGTPRCARDGLQVYTEIFISLRPPHCLALTGLFFRQRFHGPYHAQDYGAYLDADALAAAASCREMEWALEEVLRLAQQCGDYKSKERYLWVFPVSVYYRTFFMAWATYALVAARVNFGGNRFDGVSASHTYDSCMFWPAS